MKQLGMRKLPFPRQKRFTPEIVRKLKAIPNEDLRYTRRELAMMKRAIKNLDYMIALAEKSGGTDIEVMKVQREQIRETYVFFSRVADERWIAEKKRRGL